MTISIEELNQLSAKDFVDCLGGIFEHSPWVAEAVVSLRPFTTLEALHSAMVAAIKSADLESINRLICSHPQLAGKLAIAKQLTAHSTSEQKGAGLDQCNADEFAVFSSLNQKYLDKFQIPFIIAVRGHNRHSILAAMTTRLNNSPAAEQQEALTQIYKIGLLRLEDLLVQN